MSMTPSPGFTAEKGRLSRIHSRCDKFAAGTHPLKEVDGAANAVAETPEQVVRLLAYVATGKLS